MNSTKPEVHIGQAMKQNHALRDQLERVRGAMSSHLSNVAREIENIQQALRVEYTGWEALLKLEDGEWKCLACVKANDVDDDTPSDFDLALPIPDPKTLPDFEGW